MGIRFKEEFQARLVGCYTEDDDELIVIMDVDKIGKLEKLIIDGKLTLVDDDGKPLKKNGDYDEDPYDDDMYEGHDFPDKIQDIYDNLDIKVRGRRKK
ncbi:hypothetical protein Tco_1293138 [Tanacetum coccineum]